MRNKSSLMIIASMVLILLGWNVGEAATWYVTKTGNDANTGNSLATAKLTIQAMINSGSVVNGDVIEIGSGTFQEQVVITSKSLTLRGRGYANTIIQAPTWAGMTTYDEATLLYWNTSHVANSLPTSEFKPVVFVDAASNSYTVNIYGVKIDGNTAAPAAPAQLFVGIMYKNAQGTVGNSLDTGKVSVNDIKGAGGNTENTIFGFGIACIGTANPLIQYDIFTGYHNAAVASFGRSLSSTLTSQMPYPVITDCNITGITKNNTGWYAGIMSGYGGRISAQRNLLLSHRNSGGWDASGVLIYDGRNAVIGSNSVKNDGNNISDNAWGLNVIVTNSIIGTPSLYTIKNNNIAYNGNGNSGLTCSGAVTTTGCVRYENTTSAADRTLALTNNAWGHEDPLNNGYGMSTGSPVAAGANTDAFWSVTSGDKMNVANPVFAAIENVATTNTATVLGWGYSAFNTIQRAVDAAGDGTNILVGTGTYAENVCVFTKTNVSIIGDSSATCGSGSKPKISPASGAAMHIFTLGSAASFNTTNITVNGIHFLRAGTQREGILVTGWDNTNAATNNPPTGTQVRNSCFEGYATQVADGTAAASASMATEEYPFNNTGRQAYGGNVSPAVADPSDVDASANNNFNYNAVSTSPSFKLWEKTDGNIVDGGVIYNLARIIQTNLIIVYCGDDLNVALGALGTGAVTVYVQGDCIYKSAAQLTVNGPFDMRVDYTGRQNYPPIIVESNGIIYGNSAAGLTWATDCSVPGKPGYRFVTNATQTPLAASLTNGHTPSGIVPNASNTYMAGLAPANFNAGAGQYQTTNYGWNRPANITVSGSNNGALVDAISSIVDSNGYAGTITLASGAAFTTNVDLQKRLRFTVAAAGNATTTGWIRLRNKVRPFGPDCATIAGVGALDDILDTRVLSGTFTSLDVRVGTPGSAVAAEWADNTDTTNTIQQGLTFTRGASTGVCQVNNLGDYTTGTAQTPTISRTQITLTSDHATQFVQLETGSITLNGSGAPGATQSMIRRFSVPTINMSLGTDAIQTAIGRSTFQKDEGVGLDNTPGNATGATQIPGGGTNNRPGTINLNFVGATSSQALIVEKDIRFTGTAPGNTNSGSLSMSLGAQGTQIAGSTNFCNNTVNVTQVAGSGYLQIPDIQDGLLLACTGQTVNVGSTGAATTWGGVTNYGAGTDTYNRDNTINLPVTIQGTNTTNLCANNTAYIIDGAAAQGTWVANAGRTNTTTFSAFTAANPIFTISSGVSNVTIQGFDFTSIANGAALSIIYSPGTGVNISNNVTIKGNVYTGSSEIFIRNVASGTIGTYHSGWTVDCNRMIPAVALGANVVLEMVDHTNTTFNRNLYDGTGSTGNFPIVFRGFAGATANNIQNNAFVNAPSTAGNSTISIGGNGSTNATIGNVNIIRNRIGGASAGDGLKFDQPETMANAVSVANNFINSNVGKGIDLASAAPITHQLLSINNNSITGNGTGLFYTQNGATGCGINARGNWWNNASGPTNTYNPLNPTPCTAAAFGDAVSNNGVCGTDPTRISYIPWWTIGTDAAAGTDGWQEPAATNALGRVTRTNAAGAWQGSYTTINAAALTATANDRILIMQGMPHWTPAPGPAGSSAWGAYFSEYVTGLTAVAGVEFRGVTNSEYNCSASAVQTSVTYLAGTDNILNPVPTTIGAAVTPTTGTVTGSTGNGNAFEISGAGRINTTIRNLRIQGYSSITPSANPPQGAGIMATQTSGLVVDGVWFEGGSTSNTKGSWGVALDRTTSSALTSNKFGTNRDIASTSGGVGGVSILAVDASGAAAGAGTNTIGQNAAFNAVSTALGFTNGNNIIANNERAGVQIGGGGATLYAATADGGAAVNTIQFNTITGSRDAKGTGGAASLAGIYANPVSGTVNVNSNTIGGKGLPTSTQSDNNLDIFLGQAGFTFAGTNNTIRDSGQVVDGINYTVTDNSGTRGAILRTFFNPASGNTFSHAVILTTDATAPYNFGTQMGRSANVVAIGGTMRIYRQIVTPLANTSTVFSAGSETFNNIVSARENAGWTIGELDQYYAENLAFTSTTGLMHQTILGPAAANALNATSAHIISSTGPGTGTAITANGAENKYIRGGIVLHAVGNGLYGSINAGSANKGDVYLQRAASGTDAGFVQFAYHATTFGSQALVAGTGAETTGNNSNTDKPTIIKAGLDDANDDVYAVTSAQNRRTGVFQAGNGTAFTKPTEPITGLGADGLSAYPNPATGGDVTVAFQVTNNTFVRIALYDALGRKVTDLKSDNVTAGVYTTSFDVSSLLSGAYTVRMDYDYFTKTVPVLIVK
ncbi:MAG: T9SS type A sorting domain-containing protein [Bacteroidetes bacterium]|nr:T9SS type A sorting domain-containing protein [Bacteroidota bacterium]